MTEPLPCPFCGLQPVIIPTDPAKEGNAWGEVRCVSSQCVAKPSVRDGVGVSDERGSDAYKEAAIKRWNTRATLDNLSAKASLYYHGMMNKLQRCREIMREP